MTPQQLVGMGVRLFAIWLAVVVAFQTTGTSLFSQLSSDERFYLLEEVLRVFVGASFVFASAGIARRVLGATKDRGDRDGHTDVA